MRTRPYSGNEATQVDLFVSGFDNNSPGFTTEELNRHLEWLYQIAEEPAEPVGPDQHFPEEPGEQQPSTETDNASSPDIQDGDERPSPRRFERIKGLGEGLKAKVAGFLGRSAVGEHTLAGNQEQSAKPDSPLVSLVSSRRLIKSRPTGRGRHRKGAPLADHGPTSPPLIESANLQPPEPLGVVGEPEELHFKKQEQPTAVGGTVLADLRHESAQNAAPARRVVILHNLGGFHDRSGVARVGENAMQDSPARDDPGESVISDEQRRDELYERARRIAGFIVARKLRDPEDPEDPEVFFIVSPVKGHGQP